MKTAAVILQTLWLVLSVGPLFLSLFLRRISLNMAERSTARTRRYFSAQGKAWEGNAVEIGTSIIRGCAGFFLPEDPVVTLLLAIGVTGRMYQIFRLYSAYNSIVNGSPLKEEV